MKGVVAEDLSKMAWLVCFVTVALVALLGIAVNPNRISFERRLAGEMRGLLAVPPSAVPRPRVAALPLPVARYYQLAVAGHAPVRTIRLNHGGTFRLSPTAKALPIRGTQLCLGAVSTATGAPSQECACRSRRRSAGNSKPDRTPTRTGSSIPWTTTKHARCKYGDWAGLYL